MIYTTKLPNGGFERPNVTTNIHVNGRDTTISIDPDLCGSTIVLLRFGTSWSADVFMSVDQAKDLHRILSQYIADLANIDPEITLSQSEVVQLEKDYGLDEQHPVKGAHYDIDKEEPF
jgi:hypothetical protein